MTNEGIVMPDYSDAILPWSEVEAFVIEGGVIGIEPSKSSTFLPNRSKLRRRLERRMIVGLIGTDAKVSAIAEFADRRMH